MLRWLKTVVVSDEEEASYVARHLMRGVEPASAADEAAGAITATCWSTAFAARDVCGAGGWAGAGVATAIPAPSARAVAASAVRRRTMLIDMHCLPSLLWWPPPAMAAALHGS
jgi:hypothetical protein